MTRTTAAISRLRRLLWPESAPAFQTLNRIEIDHRALLANINVLRHAHPQQHIIPVLKGNAYGHGIAQVGRILADDKLKLIAVDGYFEANRLRKTTKTPMLVMGCILPQNVGQLDIARCSFVVQDIAGLHAFGALGKRVRIHLELNTGMNRLGLSANELPTYIDTLRKYPKLQLEGVMSHLADADNPKDATFTQQQLTAFDSQVEAILAAGFRPTYIHLAQTAGSTKVSSRHANGIRLGIGLYGINPLSPDDSQYRDLAALQPALELKSTIIKVQHLEKGDRVSYNGTFTAPRSMRLGILPLGYYEGVSRALSGRGLVTTSKYTLPIIGRVCMNHTMIDLQHTSLDVGDEVTVISRDLQAPNSVTRLQSDFDLFSYTTLTGLSESVRRIIV